MTVTLTADARGVLLALAELGEIRFIDPATHELADAGLAEVRGNSVRVTTRGRAAVAGLRRRLGGLARRWRPQGGAGETRS
jgi:hypothetical protein